MGQKYASYDASGIVNGYYDSIDSPLPPGVKAIPITDAEWQEAISSPYQPVRVVNGVLTIPSGPTLVQAQTSQIALLQSSFSQAEQSPISFTNAAGVSGVFLMTPHVWTKYLGEWTEYVIGKTPLPNNSGTTATFYTATGTAVEFTLADIEAFYKSGKAQIKSAEATLSAKIAAVKAATTVAEVQSITF
jgi:hypothetical protein